MRSITLYALNEYLKRVIALNFQDALWLQCEISHAAVSRGHMYLDLIEKDPNSSDIIAQSKGTIWERNLKVLKDRYGNTLFDILASGTEVNLKVKVVFHERYGLSLQIEDIDLSYTIGKLALQRKITIDKLIAAGVYDLQKRLELPPVIQKIAVISSKTAAGYIDFKTQLAENPEGYVYSLDLYPVPMQGVNAAKEIQDQLQLIAAQSVGVYDAIVIVRGGGSRIDLLAFDDYSLCEAVANLPIPVLVGIGHEIDTSVLDEIACVSLKTPTAVAEYLLERNRRFEQTLLEIFAKIGMMYQSVHRVHQLTISEINQKIILLSRFTLQAADRDLDAAHHKIQAKLGSILEYEKSRLAHFENLLESNHPISILKKGFSITRLNGKSISSRHQLDPGKLIETEFFDGKVLSKVE